MTDSNAEQPVEGQLAERLSAPRAGAGTARGRAATLLRRLDSYDRAAYRSVAQLRIPLLDEPLRLVSDFANFSKPWFLVSGFLALFGGGRGRRAALTGLAAIGTTSLVVNQPMKMAGERHRPDRDGVGVPQQRWVRMPSSTASCGGGAGCPCRRPTMNAGSAARPPLRANIGPPHRSFTQSGGCGGLAFWDWINRRRI